MIWWAISLVCIATVNAQLECHPETLTYSYVNEIRLWGAVEQRLRLTCRVDVDCHGESDLSNSSQLAFDYIVHVYNVSVSEGKVDRENAAKLCGNNQGLGATCTVGEKSSSLDGEEANGLDEEEPPEEVRATHLSQFALPVRFTQAESGAVLRVQFKEKDLENQDVLNLKKGLVSALQTKISGPGETTGHETDSTGSHTARFRSWAEGEGVLVEKEYTAGEDDSPRAQVMRTAEVRVKSRALVEHGEIVDSQGELTTQLEEDQFSADDLPLDHAPGISVEELVHSRSWYELKLTTKIPRSTSRRKRMAEYARLVFLETSLKMEDLTDNTENKLEQLSTIYEKLQEDRIQNIVEAFISSGDEHELTILKNGIALETELGYHNVQRKLDRQERHPPLIDTLVQTSYGIMSSCQEEWDTCRQLLELYRTGGGRRAEEVFEFLLSRDSPMDINHRVDITNLLSSMVNPSDELVQSLVRLISQLPYDSDSFGALLLTLGSLAGQTSVSEHTKTFVRAIIVKELEAITTEGCTEDVRYADALEAIGNMGDIWFINRLLEVSMACGNNKVTRVALFHAMRNFLHDSRVQSLMVDTLSSFECDVSEDMLNLILEYLQEQLLDETLAEKWPLSGFNTFDHALADSLTYNSDKLSCLRLDAVRYFGRKLSPIAQDVRKTLVLADASHSTDHLIAKRGVKKHSSCSQWSDFNGKYKSIASAGTFKSESRKYNKKKSCLAHFGIGPSKARINVYGAYFAGYRTPVGSLQRRLFAKVVAGGKILKKSFSLATVFLYFQTQGGKKASGRVYAKVGKKTLLDKKFSKTNYKSSKKLYSAPTTTIPVAKIPVYITTINVDLRLSASIVLTTQLRPCSKSDICLTFTPTAKGKATGRASVNLAAVRAGADLNVNLNYYVKGEARVRQSKSPCVSLSHGNDKNSVNLEFFYQLKTKVKVKVKLWPPKFKVKLKWGKKKTWKPSSLKWNFGKAKETKIYSNC